MENERDEIETENAENMDPSVPDSDPDSDPGSGDSESKKPKRAYRRREKARRGKKPREKRAPVDAVDAPLALAPTKEAEDLADTGAAIHSTVNRLQTLIDEHRRRYPESGIQTTAVDPFDKVAAPPVKVEPISPAVCHAVLTGAITTSIIGVRSIRGIGPRQPDLPPALFEESSQALSDASVYLPRGLDLEKWLTIFAAVAAVTPLCGLVVAEWREPGICGFKPFKPTTENDPETRIGNDGDGNKG